MNETRIGFDYILGSGFDSLLPYQPQHLVYQNFYSPYHTLSKTSDLIHKTLYLMRIIYVIPKIYRKN